MAGCATSLGPGYIVQSQEIRVSFREQPQPVIHVSADYRLQNTGNQPLHSLTVRMPGRRFRPDVREASWDGNTLVGSLSPQNLRDTLFRFPQTWKIAEIHTLKFAYDISPASAEDGRLGFSSDAFYLPAEGWAPELPQVPGFFGFGGVPPRRWDLLVEVPAGFLVHASGEARSRPGKSQVAQFRFVQNEHDLYPFVIAGRYRETRQVLEANQKIRIWSRSEPDFAVLRRASESLRAAIKAYDSLFGARGSSEPPLWIVECPARLGCISVRGSGGYALLLEGHAPDRAADLAARDTLLVDAGASPDRVEAAVGPALAAGWLGYGQNPGFYEQQPPMSALPAFAAALARERTAGPQARRQIIARALADIPPNATRDSARDPAVVRAKSLLLFYALRDRVGQEALEKALRHMLYARQSRGFEVADLISALEQESHQTVGPFVRQWIKRPGVPEEFRAQYRESAAVEAFPAQEAVQ